jgi:hypothetical protein
VFQQETDFEYDVIVRDDGSNDGTDSKLENLKKVYPTLKVLDGSKNLGALGNIKKLLESTDSKYIAYLDGDDTFGTPIKLQVQVNFLESHPDFVLHFTGCRYLNEDGSIFPNDERVINSVKKVVKNEDLLKGNYIGFGKLFRNIPNLIKDYFEGLPYVDWPLHYEITKHGLAFHEEIFGGLYRISDDGIFSTLTQKEKDDKDKIVYDAIQKNYFDEKYKTITIVDCYIHDNVVLSKLKKCLENLNRFGHKILLVSNTTPPTEILNLVDHFFYNSENKLFKQKYEETDLVDVWRDLGTFKAHEISSSIQKHGLSVLSNLFNCLDLAKSLGYKHFQRIEVDDLFSDEGYKFMSQIPKTLELTNKKALFYFNEGRDVSFHFFYSNIDFFINNVVRITDEDSYRRFLRKQGYGEQFKNVEIFLYDNLMNSGLNFIHKRNGTNEMNQDFPNTLWNTVTSMSNIDSKFKGCSTKIYKIEGTNRFAVFTYNLNDFPVFRKIEVYNQSIDTITHSVYGLNQWSYNIYDRIDKIKVFDNTTNEFLYEIKNENIWDNLEFK